MEADRTLLQMKYSRIVEAFAMRAHLTLEDALTKFYDSDTFMLMDGGVADMHCMSDEYLTDELMLEYGFHDKEMSRKPEKSNA